MNSFQNYRSLGDETKTCSPVFATGVLSPPPFSIMLKQMSAAALIHRVSEYETFLTLQENPYLCSRWLDGVFEP